MKKTLVCFMLVMLVSLSFVACSSNNDETFNGDENNAYNTGGDIAEDSLSGIWSVVEGGDDHSIVIANGTIQIIDDSSSEIIKYTKPSDNVFQIEFDGETWEFKYINGYLYRYENGEADGYVYERTAYNSNEYYSN